MVLLDVEYQKTSYFGLEISERKYHAEIGTRNDTTCEIIGHK